MFIQCPNCRFSGRIPSYALDRPHNARCPKCRFRFELLADSVVGMLAESELDTDPSSSSYELKAITETHSVADSRDPWENDEEAIPFNGSGDARVDPARSSLDGRGALGNTSAFPGRLGRGRGGALVFSCAPALGDRVPYLGGDDRGPQPVPSIRPRKRTDEPLRRRLQRGVGLAPRPRRRSPLPAGRPGPLHPGTSTSNFKSGERTIHFGKARFAKLAPGPILEPPFPGHTVSPFVITDGALLCWFVTAPSGRVPCKGQTTKHGAGTHAISPHPVWAREAPIQYARGDLNPQPSAPEADALSS